MLLPGVLNSISPLLEEAVISELLQTNEKTKEYGLVLSAEEIKNLIEVRNHVLHSCGRVELGIEVTRGLIEKFCTSAFINEENYVSIVNELQEVFYCIKNETEDKLGDDRLISLLWDTFENSCGGSIDLLKSTLEVFAEDFRRKEQIKDFLEGDE